MKKARDRWGLYLAAGVVLLVCLILPETQGLRATSLFKTTTTTTTTTEEPMEMEETTQSEDGSVEVSSTPKSNYTGVPQVDYIYDPNLPRELNGYNLSSYPFLEQVPSPEQMDFKCGGLHDGFYASVKYKCQVYHHCLYGTRYDFLCANYTAFDQRTFICHFVSEVDCVNSHKFFSRNDDLYKETTTTEVPTTKKAPKSTVASKKPSNDRNHHSESSNQSKIANNHDFNQDDIAELLNSIINSKFKDRFNSLNVSSDNEHSNITSINAEKDSLVSSEFVDQLLKLLKATDFDSEKMIPNGQINVTREYNSNFKNNGTNLNSIENSNRQKNKTQHNLKRQNKNSTISNVNRNNRISNTVVVSTTENILDSESSETPYLNIYSTTNNVMKTKSNSAAKIVAKDSHNSNKQRTHNQSKDNSAKHSISSDIYNTDDILEYSTTKSVQSQTHNHYAKYSIPSHIYAKYSKTESSHNHHSLYSLAPLRDDDRNDALYEPTTTTTVATPSTTTTTTTTAAPDTFRQRPAGGRRRQPGRRRRPQYDYYDDDYYTPASRDQDDYYDDSSRASTRGRRRKRPRPAQRRPAYDEYEDERYDRRPESRTRQEEDEYEDRRSYDRPRKPARRPNDDRDRKPMTEEEGRSAPRDNRNRPSIRPAEEKKTNQDYDRRSTDDDRKNERPRRPLRGDDDRRDRPLRNDDRREEDRTHRDDDRRDEKPLNRDNKNKEDAAVKDDKTNKNDNRPFRDRDERPIRDDVRPFNRDSNRPFRDDSRPSRSEGRGNNDDKRDESRGYSDGGRKSDVPEVTPTAGSLVTPVGSSLFNKPRLPPRIARPVPSNEKDKYKYVTQPSTTTFRPKNNDDDDYYDDYELEDPKTTSSSAKSTSFYRTRPETTEREGINRNSNRNLDRNSERNLERNSERNKQNFEQDVPKRPISGTSSGYKPRSPEPIIEPTKTLTAEEDSYEDVEEPLPKLKRPNGPLFSRGSNGAIRYPIKKRPVRIEEDYEYDDENVKSRDNKKERERYVASRNKEASRDDDYVQDVKEEKQTTKPFFSRNRNVPTTTVATTTVAATTEPTYVDDKDSNKNSPYIRVVKRPFLPSRGGSPYLPRGLQPLGGKSLNNKTTTLAPTTTTTTTVQTTTENVAPISDYNYENDYDVKDDRTVNEDKVSSAEVVDRPEVKQSYQNNEGVKEERRNIEASNDYNDRDQRDKQVEDRYKDKNADHRENIRNEEETSSDKDYNQSSEVIYKDIDDTKENKYVKQNANNRGKVIYEAHPGDDYRANLDGRSKNKDSKEDYVTDKKVDEVFKPSPQISNPYKPTNRPYTPKIPEHISIKQNLADSVENDYDVTLNDALNPTLTPVRNFPSPFIMPTDRDYTYSRFRNPYNGNSDSSLSSTQNYPNYQIPNNRQQNQGSKYDSQRYIGGYNKQNNRVTDSSAAGSEYVPQGISVRTPQSFFIQQPGGPRFSADETNSGLRSGHLSYRQVLLGDYL